MKFNFGLLLIILFSCSLVEAQKAIEPSHALKITGKIRKEISYTIANLDTFTSEKIKDQFITNHQGEMKDTLKNMKGIKLINLLQKVEYDLDKPKELNEFYLVFKATDGYKVVFSWNEIYNTEIGLQVFIITEIEGKKTEELPAHIQLICLSDFKTGRRYIKGLESIEVKKAN
jgi:hypothetical protein